MGKESRSTKLTLKAIERLGELPMHTDYRLVISRVLYDDYKEMYKLTDDQMATRFLVSDYIK